ncbi:MAG: hypothetical protein QXM27_01140 [Candidatus Pacearchaeota archaeon]
MKKRGQNINITTIIILVLAILVLLIVAISFTGGWTKLWERITGTYKTAKGAEIGQALHQCEFLYITNNKKSFCCDIIEVINIGNTTCKDLFERGYTTEKINSTIAVGFCEEISC